MIRRKPSRRQDRLQDSLHPPTNVRLVGVDGTEYPVQTVYTGMEAGQQVYEVVDPPAGVRFTGMRCEELPGFTSVVFPQHYRPGGDA